MARIRTIKPEFWTSEQISECSVNARLLFIGLWNFCDDAGRHVASVKRLKMEVYPGDAFKMNNIRAWVDELIAQELVIEYESQGVEYWQVTGWHHQKINRPQESKIPCPFTESSVNIHSGRERKGKEGNGRDLYTPTSRFDEWWELWPRKVQKSAAAKAYAKAASDVGHDKLIDHVKLIRDTPKAKSKFCPYPATYLNQGRWDDDLSEWTGDFESDGSTSPSNEDLLESILGDDTDG